MVCVAAGSGAVVVESVRSSDSRGAAIVEPVRAPVMVLAPVIAPKPTPPPVIAPETFGDNSVGVRKNDGLSAMEDCLLMKVATVGRDSREGFSLASATTSAKNMLPTTAASMMHTHAHNVKGAAAEA